MNRFSNLFVVINTVLALMIAIRLWDPVPVQVVRSSIFDLYQRISPRQVEELPVTVIDIDEKSLQELGQWPWSRSILSDLLEKLSIVQPLVIGFDIVFPEPDRLSPSLFVRTLPKQLHQTLEPLAQINNDRIFSQAISNLPVVLGTMASESEATAYPSELLKSSIVMRDQLSNPAPRVAGRTGNIRELETSATGVGVLTLLPEPDGVVRRVPTLFRIGDTYWPSFGLELLRVALKEDHVVVNLDQAGIDSLEVGGISIPANASGLTWVHFNRHRNERFISASDILSDRVAPEILTGHIVLIGASAAGLHDIKMTPMAQQMSGVEIWAQWIESSLFGQLLQRPSYIFIAELIFVFLVGQLLIILTGKARARTSLAVFCVLVLACGGFSWWLYSHKLQLFDMSFPIFTLGLLFALLMYLKFHTEERQRKQIRDAFSHYLSPAIVDEISRNPNTLKLGGEVRVITSLFTDLQGFTLLSEMSEPESLVDLINQYLDGICQIIIRHNGTIDKIIGDAVHAIFGAPHNLMTHADNAVECAMAIDRFAWKFRQRQLSLGIHLGNTRIGVNSGEAVVGNFGGEVRFDYTAYGDTINTASRIESANQHLGTRVCVTQSTVDLCQQKCFRPIAQITVKGKQDPIGVYEPVSENSPARAYIKEYAVVYSLLCDSDPRARHQLQQLLEKYPNDKVLKNQLDHIERGESAILRQLG